MATTRGDVGINIVRSRFYRLGQFAYRRRFWVLGVWLLILFAAFGPLKSFNDRLSQGGFEVPGSQSAAVAAQAKTDFKGQFQYSDLLVMRSTTLRATDPAFRATFVRVRRALSKAPGIGAVSNPYASLERSVSRDGHVLTASGGLTDNQSQALKHSPAVEKAVTD